MNTSRRELVADDINTLYEVFAKGAIEIVSEGREVFPQIAIVRMDDEQPGHIQHVSMLDPELVNQFQKNGRRKDVLMEVIKALLDPAQHTAKSPFVPHAIVHVTEMWMVSHQTKPGEPMPDLDAVCEGHESLADHPRRSEVISVVIHTPGHSIFGICPIEGAGAERRATFKPLLTNGIMAGRFSLDDAHGAH